MPSRADYSTMPLMQNIKITLFALLIGVYQTTVAADFNFGISHDKLAYESSPSVPAQNAAPIADNTTAPNNNPSLTPSHSASATTVAPASFEASGNQKSSWSGYAQEVIASALSLMGVKYTWGGKVPESGMDCSGFVRFVFQEATSLTLPHGARAISRMGSNVATHDLQPGDLVFFNTLKSSFSHVGIYIGENRFIHSPRTGKEIEVTDMTESYWAKRFNGARRINPNELGAVNELALNELAVNPYSHELAAHELANLAPTAKSYGKVHSKAHGKSYGKAHTQARSKAKLKAKSK